MLPVHESWQVPLAPVEDQIHAMGDFLRAEGEYLPRGNDILRAFADPFEDVRVLILGQDPYPTPGHPMGLAFSTQPGVAAPRSLVNIYKELQDDLGVPPRKDGDLSSWSKQGILLLNRVLTVRPGAPASHPAGGHPVGPRRADGREVLGRHPAHRVAAPLAAVRLPRVLRLPAVLPGESGAGEDGCPAGQLGTLSRTCKLSQHVCISAF